MAANKIFRLGPLALTTALTTNLLNPPTATGGINGGSSPAYIILRHLRIANKTSTAATFSLWLGASAGNVSGTEVIGTGYVVPPNSAIDWYGMLRLDSTDFLVGGANAATALTLTAEGEIGIAG